MESEIKKNTVSYSQYSEFSKCPRCWKLGYIDKLKKYENSINTAFGTALHKAIQTYLTTLYDKSLSEADSLKLFPIFEEEFKAQLCNPQIPKDVSDKGFFYDFTKFNYHVSGYRYSLGMLALKEMIRNGYQMPDVFEKDFIRRFMEHEKQMFCFVFQLTKRPFSTRLKAMTPYVSELGHTDFIRGLYRIRDFYLNPKYDAKVQPLAYPDVEQICEGDIYVPR